MHEIAQRLIFAVILATVPCMTAIGSETRVALVIGNAEYAYAPLLNNPVNDGEDVTEALERLGFSVTLLENADQTALRRGLQQFARAASVAQFALVYYAGHGIEVDRRNFLVPVDARLTSDADIEFETVPLDLVLQSVSRASFRLIILDACRENPFTRTMQSAGTTRSIGRGLALIEPPGGMLVAYSAKEGTLAEDGDGRNSPYAQALLRLLEQPDLEVGIMFRHVRDEVLAATGGRQEPFTYGSLPKAGIYFRLGELQPSTLVVVEEPSPDVGQRAPQAPIVDEVDEIRWTVRGTDVYSGADAASEVVRRLQPAAEVEVTGTVRGSDWLRVVGDRGGLGFVVGAALIDRYPVEDVDGLYRAERHANVRSGPGVGYEKVHRLEPGDGVAVTGRFHETDWLRIILDGGAEGYVTSPMLSDRFPTASAGGIYRAARAVDVRSRFGIGWETVETLEPGTEVEVTGRVHVMGSDWLRVSLDAGDGFLPEAGLVDTAADDRAFERAKASGTASAYAAYLTAYPEGRHATDARGLQDQAREAERKQPGQVFRDCERCPAIVVVPAGTYVMGSPASEEGRRHNEGPQRRVRIGEPLAVGVYEVTFAEWDACAGDGGCGGYRPDDEGWGRRDRPVINVSWDDAQAYVRWLSTETGEEYRLLSASEWEYVARAGTATPFYAGRTISTEQANYNGNYVYGAGRMGRYRAQTVPVGSFSANAFGLHEVHGNVWEWTQDCGNEGYRGAPVDGRAWERGDCGRRVVRGGSWYSRPRNLRSALHFGLDSGSRGSIGGFRVARTLTP